MRRQVHIPDEAIEAATGVELGDLNETVEAPWHLQPEEARRVLEAALPHILTHRAEAEAAAELREVVTDEISSVVAAFSDSQMEALLTGDLVAAHERVAVLTHSEETHHE